MLSSLLSFFLFSIFSQCHAFSSALFKFSYEIINFVAHQVRLTRYGTFTFQTNIRTLHAIMISCHFLIPEIGMIMVNFIHVDHSARGTVGGILKCERFSAMFLCRRLLFKAHSLSIFAPFRSSSLFYLRQQDRRKSGNQQQIYGQRWKSSRPFP